MLRTVATMPNHHLFARELLSAAVCVLRRDATGAKLSRDFVLARVEAGEGLLVGTIPCPVRNDECDIIAERSRVSGVLLVAVPGGIADMDVGGMRPHRLKKLDALGVENGIHRGVTPSRRETGLDLRRVLEITAVGQADGKRQAFGFLEEVLVIGRRIDPPENRVLRLTFATGGTRKRTDPENVTCARALLETGRMAGDDGERRLIDAPRLPVPEPDMRKIKELPLVLLLEVREIRLHQPNCFCEFVVHVVMSC